MGIPQRPSVGNLPRNVAFLALLLAVSGLLAYRYLYPAIFEAYTGVVNAPLTYDNSVHLSGEEFNRLAAELTAHGVEYGHVRYFRKAKIRRYEGPSTCLGCHPTIKVRRHDGEQVEVDPLEDVVNSVHFKFQRAASGFTTFGYDGREVNAEGSHPIPVGKINRACGIPGSFSWTGWAALIKTRPEGKHGEIELRSEGCGQCHIGGNYHPATEKMMPVGDVPDEAREGIDCLICHSATYDMNYRYVIEDDVGLRWNQDRTLRAALTVGRPTNEMCLRCHQHNMGGDIYAQNVAAQSLGYRNRRILHAGAKRANPFHPSTDVHYAAGIVCIDCHVPEGHKIPRGTKGTDLVANDLPGVEVTCEGCHSDRPHPASAESGAVLNAHVRRLACETCHITKLEDFNVVLRDWVHPTWNAEEGIYTPTDIYWSGEAGKGFTFLWFNGYGTFLANALGDNPSRDGAYDPFMKVITTLDSVEVSRRVGPAVSRLAQTYRFDSTAYVRAFTNTLTQMSPQMAARRDSVVRAKLRPLMARGESRIYPFKLFNAMMYEDMGNQGPFGAMILPFDYPTYYETGNPQAAVKTAISHPIVKRMYQQPFKRYMMDEFMRYFGAGEWNADYPLEDGELVNVEPHWMRQMGTLMVSHGIQKQGRRCTECHAPDGIMDFEALGYAPEAVARLLSPRAITTASAL